MGSTQRHLVSEQGTAADPLLQALILGLWLGAELDIIHLLPVGPRPPPCCRPPKGRGHLHNHVHQWHHRHAQGALLFHAWQMFVWLCGVGLVCVWLTGTRVCAAHCPSPACCHPAAAAAAAGGAAASAVVAVTTCNRLPQLLSFCLCTRALTLHTKRHFQHCLCLVQSVLLTPGILTASPSNLCRASC